MKKILTLLAACIMAASCARTTNEYSGQSGVRFYRDPVTGVEYVLYNSVYGCAITPRLNPDGTPYTAWTKEM